MEFPPLEPPKYCILKNKEGEAELGEGSDMRVRAGGKGLAVQP